MVLERMLVSHGRTFCEAARARLEAHVTVW
jgi:endonuclease III